MWAACEGTVSAKAPASDLRRLWAAGVQGAHDLRQLASKGAPQPRSGDIVAPLVARRIRPRAQLAPASAAGVGQLPAELVDPGLYRRTVHRKDPPGEVSRRASISRHHKPWLLLSRLSPVSTVRYEPPHGRRTVGRLFPRTVVVVANSSSIQVGPRLENVEQVG